jgi:hypothetical protein
MTPGEDIFGVTHAYLDARDRYPVCARFSHLHDSRYVAAVHLANRPLPGRPITCLWCTLRILGLHAR